MTFSFRTLTGADFTFPIKRLHQIKPISTKLYSMLEITILASEDLTKEEYISYEAIIFQIDRPEFSSGWDETNLPKLPL